MNSNRARAQRKVLNFSYTDYGLPGRQNRITGSGNSIWAYIGTATGSGKDFHARVPVTPRQPERAFLLYVQIL